MVYIPTIVTLITFVLIYSKFSERCPTPCLGISTIPPAFIKKLKKLHDTRLLKSSENSTPPPRLFRHSPDL